MVVYAKKSIIEEEDEVEGGTLILKDQPCVIQKVHITGLKKTKGDYVVDDLKKVMDSKSFITAYEEALKCRDRLLQKGIFDDIEVIMDTTSHYKGNKVSNGLQILFRAKEKRSLTGEARTEMSTTDQPCWVLRLISPNVFGRGEQISASFSRKFGSQSVNDGMYSPNDFSLTAMKPCRNGSIVRISVLKDKQECPWNSTNLTTRGAQVEYQFRLFNNIHSFAWHAHWRELASSNNATAFPIREQFGHSVKSSIVHSVTMDRTDAKILPTKGYLIKMTEEFAGVGAGDKYLSENVDMHFHKSFFERITLSTGLRFGFVAPLTAAQPKLVDRFHIGGPLTLRGFHLNHAGPHVDEDSMGGNCYWLTGIHAYLPLPFYWKKFGNGSWLDSFRVHGFINAGNVLSFDPSNPVKNQLSKIVNDFRLSYGAGLVYNFMRSARIELNFCLPHRIMPGDKFCDGVQFGIGISNV